MNLDLLIDCIKRSWDESTAQPHDGVWSSDNPAKGQCCTTSMLLLKHIPDATLMRGLIADQGEGIIHYWIRLPDGTDLDITKDQFVDPHIVVAEADPDEKYYVFYETNRRTALLEERALALYAKMESQG